MHAVISLLVQFCSPVHRFNMNAITTELCKCGRQIKVRFHFHVFMTHTTAMYSKTATSVRDKEKMARKQDVYSHILSTGILNKAFRETANTHKHTQKFSEGLTISLAVLWRHSPECLCKSRRTVYVSVV